MEIVFVPNFEDRPSNPARCIIPTGKIEINNSVWAFLPDEQREFVLQHEIGHYKGKTYDELKADDYALSQMALKKPNSLYNHYKSVKTISHNDKKRVNNAMFQTLKISAKEGNKTAQHLLCKNFQYANADGNTQEDKDFLSSLIIIIIILTVLLCYWILKKSF